MAYQKGEPVWRNKKAGTRELGIWRLADEPGYLVDISVYDTDTGERMRLRRAFNRVDTAKTWRNRMQNEGEKGKLNRAKKRSRISFRDFADEYLKKWGRQRKTSTLERETSRIETLLKPYFDKKPLHAITRRDIEQYLAGRRDTGIGQATANRELCRIKNMLKMAVAWGQLDSNPAEAIKQEKEEPEEAEYLEKKEDVNALIEACPAHIRPIVTVAVNTGMRWGEIIHLEWRDVDFKNRIVTARKTKNNETRFVPMNKAVVEALQNHRTETAKQIGEIVKYVFPNPNTGNPYVDIRRALKKAFKDAKVEPVKFHELRHTAASHMVMAGVDLQAVGKILGHKTAQMTLRYSHLAPDYLKDSVERLDYSDVGQDEEGVDEMTSKVDGG